MGGVFACKQLLFAFNAPAIASELAIVAYHAMAWDEDGDRIAGTGLRHCSHVVDELRITNAYLVACMKQTWHVWDESLFIDESAITTSQVNDFIFLSRWSNLGMM